MCGANPENDSPHIRREGFAVTVTNDPFRPLRIEYLEGARARMETLAALTRAAVEDAASLQQLRRLAHNLRGSGMFYGFPAITAAAERLEELVRARQEDAGAVAAEELYAAAEALAAAVREAPQP